LVHIDGYSDPPDPATLIGRDVHSYIAAKLLGVDPLPGPTQTPPEFRADWPDMQRLADWRLSRINVDHLIGIEERIEATWPDGAMTVALEVAIDALEMDDDLITIHDWKAGWKVPTEEEMKTDLQTWTYAWAVRTRYPSATRYRVSQTHFRFQGREVWAQFDAEKLDAFAEGLRDEVHRIATDVDFRPNVACERCPPGAHALQIEPYKTITLQTADGTTKVQFPPITSQDDYVATAERLRVAETIVWAVKAAMKEYGKQHGPAILPTGGGYGYWYQARREWHNVWRFLEDAHKHGVDLDKVVSIDMDALKRYLKRDPQLEQLIAEVMEEIPDSNYGWRKDAVAAALKAEERRSAAEEKIMGPLTGQLQVLEGGK
jgi:hypothetical protein